jgi:hypothetical protein
MEWAPKLLDNLDSAALALYQSWAGYYRWVFLRLTMTIVAVAAMTISPAIRLLAIAIVTTYISLEMIDRLILRRRQPRAATARG